MPDLPAHSRTIDDFALDHLEHGICIVDADMRLAYANATFVRLMRYPERLCRPGAPLLDLVAYDCRRGIHGPEPPETVLEVIRSGMAAHELASFDMSLPDDGVVRMTRRRLPDGRFVYSVSDITPVRDVAQQLERNAAVIRHISDSVAIADFNGRIRYRNPAFGKLFGGVGHADEFPKLPPIGLKSDESWQSFPEALEAAVAEEGRFEFSFSFQRDDMTGSLFVRAIVLPYRDVDSSLSGYLAIYKDVTGYHTKMKRLERQNRVLAQLADAVLVGSPDGYVIDANPAAERIYGYSVAELGRKRFLELISRNPKSLELSPDEFYDRLRSGSGWHGKLDAITKSGREIVVDCNVQPFYDDHGRLEGFIGIHRDVTERLRSREALQRQALIIEHMSDAAVVTDADGRVEEFNASAARMFGIHHGQALTPALREKLAIIARGVCEDGRFEGIYVFRDEENSDVEAYYDSLGVAVRDQDGAVRHVVSIHRDITERVRHQREQARLTEQIEKWKHLESLGHLAGQIAHDFNNSLTPIAGYARMALDRLEVGTVAHGYLKKVIGGTERAQDMTRRILTFGQQAPVELRPLPLDKTLGDSLDLLEGALPDTVTLERQLGCDSLFLALDPTLLHQLVMNLGTNAAQAMPEGGCLRVSTDRSGDWARIRREEGLTSRDHARIIVEDTGAGVPEHLQQKIFEPLFSTKPSGKGTGLGLAVVLGVVRLHGGAIRMDSAPGKGARFEIYLPLNLDRPGEFAQASLKARETANGAAPAQAPRRATAWIVDDDPQVGQLVAEMMQADGYKCDIFNRATDVLRRIGEADEIPDILVSDVSMPDMDGLMLIDAMWSRGLRLPVVLMSGQMSYAVRIRAECRGVRAFLDKPVTAERLQETIKKATRMFDKDSEAIGVTE